jgi:hypothetical protein
MIVAPNETAVDRLFACLAVEPRGYRIDISLDGLPTDSNLSATCKRTLACPCW